MEPLDRLAEHRRRPALGRDPRSSSRKLELTKPAVRHAVASKRLFRIHPGVFVVGRAVACRRPVGWRAAVLAVRGRCASQPSRRGGALGDLRGRGLSDRRHRADPERAGTHPQRRHPAPSRDRCSRSMADRTERRAGHGSAAHADRRGRASCRRRGLRPSSAAPSRRHDLSLIDLHRLGASSRDASRSTRACAGCCEEWVAKTNLTRERPRARVPDLLRRASAAAARAAGGLRGRAAPRGLHVAGATTDRGDRRLALSPRHAAAGAADAAKDRRLKALGYEVLRFTWAEIVNTPAATARELRAAIKRRRLELQSR